MAELLVIIAGVCFVAAIAGGWWGLKDYDPLNDEEDEHGLPH